MKRTLAVLFALATLAAPASAAAGPKIPTNCHELNDLLGIDNVRSCDGS